ncbi:MAG: AbrB/MazE/SpoVT family DNA-binding domain-containing protein [Alphaproteobacteria bacterium]
MRAPVRKLGNSSGVIIPKSLLDEVGVGVGDAMEISLQEGRIVLAPVRRRARAGWSNASKAIAEADDDALVWPEFGNAGDEALDW